MPFSIVSSVFFFSLLAEYHPPTPPPKTGFHRYQFLLFEQLPHVPVSLTEQESSSRGNDSIQQHLKIRAPSVGAVFLSANTDQHSHQELVV